MSENQKETKKKRTRRFKIPDDYIPVDCWREAKEFFITIRDDVDIYKKFKCFPNMKQSEEADRFVAWWDLERFADYPHSLILIYENLDDINNQIRNDIRQYALQHGLEFYDLRQNKGLLRSLMIRTSNTGELMFLVQFRIDTPEE